MALLVLRDDPGRVSRRAPAPSLPPGTTTSSDPDSLESTELQRTTPDELRTGVPASPRLRDTPSWQNWICADC